MIGIFGPVEAAICVWMQWATWLHSDSPTARAEAAEMLLAWGEVP